MRWVVVGVIALCLATASRIAAQGPTLQGHPEDYPRADIEYGARLYSAQCASCHGDNGAGVFTHDGELVGVIVDASGHTEMGCAKRFGLARPSAE
jgi:mono/diheme cytochrome c family protein